MLRTGIDTREKPQWELKYLQFLDEKYMPNGTTSNNFQIMNEENSMEVETEPKKDNGLINDRPSSFSKKTVMFLLKKFEKTNKTKLIQ